MQNSEVRDINAIVVGERFRKDLGDIQGLAQSIKVVGLLHPIVITTDGRLIAGERRLEACRSLGWTKIPVTIVDIRDLLRGQADENSVRKDLVPSEAVAIASVLEPEIKKASERHDVQSEKELEASGGNFPPSGTEKTRDKLARFVGMSGRTLEKARHVVNAAQQDPAKYSHLVEKMDRKGKVDGAFRELRRLRGQNSSAETAATSLTEELFSVIFAVPPWTEAHQGDEIVGHKEQVQVLSLKEMKKLKPPIAANAVMFLQTPPASLPSALELLAAWGFTYTSFHVWPCSHRSPSGWFTEIHYAVLFGVMGNNPTTLPENLVSSIIPINPLLPISKAPTVQDRVERMFPRKKYLEVFTKSNRPGWTSWPGHAESDEGLEKAVPGNTTLGSS
jgi:ParB family chromosome partitioning protein